jgi:hypothetical protein
MVRHTSHRQNICCFKWLCILLIAGLVFVQAGLPLQTAVTNAVVLSDATDQSAEYMIWRADMNGKYESANFPALPAGVALVRAGIVREGYSAESKRFHDWATDVSIAFLGSDGHLYAKNYPLNVQVSRIEAMLPDVPIVDFIVSGDVILQVLLGDGRVAYVGGAGYGFVQKQDPFAAGNCQNFPVMPLGVKFSKLLSSSTVLRSDGRVVTCTQFGSVARYQTSSASNIVNAAGVTYQKVVRGSSCELGIMYIYLRSDGRATRKVEPIETAKCSLQSNSQRDHNVIAKFDKLSNSIKYIGMSAVKQGLVLLRQDNKLTYLNMHNNYYKTPSQPPQPPKGLRYTKIKSDSITSPEDNIAFGQYPDEITLYRSDGGAVAYRCMDLTKSLLLTNCSWVVRSKSLEEGWQMTDLAYSNVPAYVVRRINPTTKTAIGIVSATSQHAPNKLPGRFTTIRIKVATQGQWGGGVIKVSAGGDAIYCKQAKGTRNYLDIRVKTQRLSKMRYGRIAVQYLGNQFVKKSAKTVLTVAYKSIPQLFS